MDNKDTGLLLNEHNIKLQRQWFNEMCHLLGIRAKYRFPTKSSKDRDINGELYAFYSEETPVFVIYEQNPPHKTMKKLGWVSELDEGLSIISVPYDLPNLQEGCLFKLPAAFDGAEGRLFKVIKMSGVHIYPASITCEVGPVYESDFDRSQLQHIDNNTILLRDGEYDQGGSDFMNLKEDDREDTTLR